MREHPVAQRLVQSESFWKRRQRHRKKGKEVYETFVVALEHYHLVAFDHQFRGEIVGDQGVEYEMEVLPSPVVRDEGGVDVDFFKKRPFAKI